MPRICWSDPQPEVSVRWPDVALVTATLFLNFHFYFLRGRHFPMSMPLPRYATILAIASVLTAVLFYVGPATICRRTGKPIVEAVASSLGTVPAYVIRVATAWFVAQWLAEMAYWPATLIVRSIEDDSRIADLSAMLAVLGFIAVTTARSMRVCGSMAIFSNKLGVAILIAGLIRVRHTLPLGWSYFPSDRFQASADFLMSFSAFALWVGPLVFLAASLAGRIQDGSIRRTAAFGVVLPMFVALLATGMSNIACLLSSCYQPSLEPSMAMVLFHGVARSAQPGLYMLVAISIFGAMRLGTRVLAEATTVGRFHWRFLIPAYAFIVWRLYEGSPYNGPLIDIPAACLILTAAIMTADALTGNYQSSRRFDRVGIAAMLAGAAAGQVIRYWESDPWWHTWVLPAYLTAFLVCLVARRLQEHSGVPERA